MFRKIGKVLFLIGGIMAATLIAACGSGEQGTKSPNPTTTEAVAKAATPPGTGIMPKPTAPSKPVVAPAAATALPTTTGMGGVAATVALAAMAVPPPPSEPVDPCRALPCSDDSDPWLGCRYAAALYRDAPGTVQGVRRVVSKMTAYQLEWYKEALLESYARDLWYSADYRLGDATDLEQTHRDVKTLVFGDKETEAMGEDVICGLLGSTEITLADILAASRSNSPFVAKKKPAKATSKIEILEDPPAPAPLAETGCGTDPCPPPPTEGAVPAEGAAPATPGCGADPCPPPTATPVAPDPAAIPTTDAPAPVPAEPPAGEMPPATPAFDPAAVPPATDPIPVAPPTTDPAAPSEPGGAAPPATAGEGTVAYNSGHGF